MRKYILSHQKNIRDLGGLVGYQGKTIKYGRLFRGGAFGKVNDEDIEILKSFHLTDVVDFRGDEEFFNHPDYHLEGVRYHNFPAIQEKIKKEDRHLEDGNLIWFVRQEEETGFEHLKIQYRELITVEKSREAYRNFFEIVMQENRSIYYHCSQGKDRAGLASFLLEIGLGVSMEDAIDDYLLTNVAMEERIKKILEDIKSKPFYNERYHQSIIDVFSARMEYLNESIKTMNEEYGGILQYMEKGLGVDIAKLRSLYLE